MQRSMLFQIIALALLTVLVAAVPGPALPSRDTAYALNQEPCVDPDDPARPPAELPAGCPTASPEVIPSPVPAVAPPAEVIPPPAPSAEDLPTRPGTVLLHETFDDPSSPLFWGAPRVPGQSDLGFVDGYLRVRRLTEGGTAVFLLPADAGFDDATIAVDAQLTGEVAGRFVLLGCRRQDTETQSGYRLAVAPDAGLFTLVRRDAAVEIPLSPWQESGTIRRGSEWNHLELTCAGSAIDASVNGQVVASVQDEVYPRGQVLLGVGVFPGQGVPAEAYFDELVVTRR